VSLLDDLTAASASVDTQYQPSSNQVPGLLAALVAYTEHGDAFLEAAGEDDGGDSLNKLLSGAEPDDEPEPDPGDAKQDAPPQTDEELERQISDLRARHATRRATAQQTVPYQPEGED
jgi:hypothetical protein